MRLNPNKGIGKVLYLVEGDVDEVVLLKQIFHEILNYTTISYDKRNKQVTCLSSPEDKYSKVYIVPMRSPAPISVLSSADYVDYIYSVLKQYGLEKDECAKYLIFDRDNLSNTHKAFEKLFHVFKNSLDNDSELGGLLLVSYPCVQSFLLNCYGDKRGVRESQMMKKACKGKYHFADLKELPFLNGAEKMMEEFLHILGEKDFNLSHLDDMEEANLKVLNYQDDRYDRGDTFLTLSLVFLSFIDLGIIEL